MISWLAVRAFFGKIPREVLYLLAVLALCFAGWRWHLDKVSDADQAGYDRAMLQVAEKAAEVAAKAAVLKANVDNLQGRINERERVAYATTVADIGARADALRVRGPGAATYRGGTCPAVGDPGLPGSAVGADGKAVAVPDDKGTRAIVDWVWLTTRAEERDTAIARVNAWQSWYAAHKAAWDAWLVEAAKASK